MGKEMKTLVFATNNKHKLKEAKNILKGKCNLMSLEEIGCNDDIPETGTTLQENALIKAKWVAERYGFSCFADDTGLEVEALNGAPGVYSARYAGEKCSFEDNINKLLSVMEGITHRKARFRTVVAYIDKQQTQLFEGSVGGTILTERKGTDGFGYDAVFLPEGYSQTFAQLTEEEKNAISHRGRALRAFAEWFLKED